MNSIEIKSQLELVQQLFTYESKSTSNYKKYSVAGLINLRRAIKELEKTKLFLGRIQRLKQSTWYDGFQDQDVIENTENTEITNFITFVKIASQGISQYLNLTNQYTGEYILHIYLPSNYSFSDLESLSNDLKKCIEIPSIDVGGTASIISAQPGSIWFVVALSTSVAISIVGKIIKIATRANLEIQKAKIFENYAQGLKLGNELTETILEAQKNLIDGIIAKEIEEAKVDLDTSDDITKVDRLKLAVTTMSELLRKDIKILPSPKMELDILEQFPDDNQIETLENELKQLTAPKQISSEDEDE